MLPRRPAHHALAFVALLGLLPLAASCAAASRGALKEPERPLPNDVEGTLDVIHQAEGDLLAALGARAPADKTMAKTEEIQAAPAEAAPPPPAAQRPAEEESAPAARDDTEARSAPAASPCTRACKALASMQRATDHLCGLSGEGDPRCTGARDRVRSATDRVRASCPPCGEE